MDVLKNSRSQLETDVDNAVDSLITTISIGENYSAHEAYAWIKQELEGTSINAKNMADGLKEIWENVKTGDGVSAGALARSLGAQAAETAERYIRLAARCYIAANRSGDDI